MRFSHYFFQVTTTYAQENLLQSLPFLNILQCFITNMAFKKSVFVMLHLNIVLDSKIMMTATSWLFVRRPVLSK